MRNIFFLPKIKRDYKRLLSRGKNLVKLDQAAQLLSRTGLLPVNYQPHKLSGKYDGLWECHLEQDWLLIYDITEKEVILHRTGSHADLFE